MDSGEIYAAESVPEEWKEGYLAKIPKKGDLRFFGNYRGVSMLSITGKILNIIIINRIKDKVLRTYNQYLEKKDYVRIILSHLE